MDTISPNPHLFQKKGNNFSKSHKKYKGSLLLKIITKQNSPSKIMLNIKDFRKGYLTISVIKLWLLYWTCWNHIQDQSHPPGHPWRAYFWLWAKELIATLSLLFLLCHLFSLYDLNYANILIFCWIFNLYFLSSSRWMPEICKVWTLLIY